MNAVPLPLAAAAALAVLGAFVFLAWRAVHDFGRRETTRGVLQSLCAAMGILFVGFTLWTLRLPELRGSAWTLRDEIGRAHV